MNSMKPRALRVRFGRLVGVAALVIGLAVSGLALGSVSAGAASLGWSIGSASHAHRAVCVVHHKHHHHGHHHARCR